MKLTKDRLKLIIKEELEQIMDEIREPKGGDDEGPPDREGALHSSMVDLMDKEEELAAKMKKAEGSEKEKLKKQLETVRDRIQKLDRQM